MLVCSSILLDQILAFPFLEGLTVQFLLVLSSYQPSRQLPFASHFALTGALKRYGRVKKMGLPERYRLFFRAFDTPELKSIVILWLGFPRKDGAKNDCYQVFTKMVARGTFPDNLDELITEPEKTQDELD
jgi:toxin YhaV